MELWRYSVEVDFGRITGHESAIHSGAATVSEARKELEKSVNYYLTLEAGMKVSKIQIKQACPVCQGHGKKYTKRKRMFPVECKACNGKGYPVVILRMTGLLEAPHDRVFQFQEKGA